MSENTTRARILAATRALLQEAAGATPTVGQVAAAAHVSRATLYRYFPDKATLLHAAGATTGEARPAATPRERILEAFLEVAGERGLYAATLDDIAERAGLSRSGLLWHYKNKEQLVADLARHIDVLPRVQAEVINAAAPDADIERQLTSFLAVLAKHGDRYRGIGRVLLFESAYYPEVARLAAVHGIGRVLPLLTEFFEEHARNGRLRPGTAQVRAQAIMGMFMGLVVMRPAFAHLLAPDEAATAREFVDILVHGILSTERPE